MSRRAVILEAATSVLQSQGPESFTIRSVARAAGCSTTGVYTWFGSKNELVEALFVEGFESLDDNLRSITDLLDAALAYRRWAIEHPTHYLVMFARAVPDFEPSSAALLRSLDSFALMKDRVRNHVQRRNHGNPPTEATVDQLSLHTWATEHGMIMLELTSMVPVGGEPEGRYREALSRLIDSF